MKFRRRAGGNPSLSGGAKLIDRGQTTGGKRWGGGEKYEAEFVERRGGLSSTTTTS